MLVNNSASGEDRGDMFAANFHSGTGFRIFGYLGSHPMGERRLFRLWEPYADEVFVCGDFNGWSRSTPMQRITDGGIWQASLEASAVGEGGGYKYLVVRDGKEKYMPDPFAIFSQKLPDDASIIYDLERLVSYEWQDSSWLSYRRKAFAQAHDRVPLNIYELHLPSWRKRDDGSRLTLCELARDIASYTKQMGYTHVELLPLAEHGSAAPIALSPTIGTPEELCAFVDAMHCAGVGVLLDWGDGEAWLNALGKYSGVCGELQSIVVSSAMFWLEMLHLDGLRVNNVSLLVCRGAEPYLDGIDLLQRLNGVVKSFYPDVIMTARDAGDQQCVTGFENDGLGFAYRWDAIWSQNALQYCRINAQERSRAHDSITFPMTYAGRERFLLHLSETEVQRGHGCLLEQMYGDYWRKFATARAFYGLMMTHPGKKLSFMGNEIGQFKEWDPQGAVEWFLLDFEMHAKFQLYCAELNHLYLSMPPLWELDGSADGFEWIDAENREMSVFSYVRRSSDGHELVVVINFTEETYENFIVGVRTYGEYRELISSDERRYGGSGVTNGTVYSSAHCSSNGLPFSIKLKLAPLAVTVLEVIPKDLSKELARAQEMSAQDRNRMPDVTSLLRR